MERIRSLAQQQQITPALPSSGAAAVRAEVRLLLYSGIMPSNIINNDHNDREIWMVSGQFEANVLGNTKENENLNILRNKKNTFMLIQSSIFMTTCSLERDKMRAMPNNTECCSLCAPILRYFIYVALCLQIFSKKYEREE